jgi:hypothetical protein
MPALFLPYDRASLLYESARFCLYVQRRRHAPGKPWGSSESAFYALDAALNYRYKAHGCPELALKRGLEEGMVVAPYGSFLALAAEPAAALRNLRRLAALGARTLGGEAGRALETIILASSILYERAGPGLAKLSLYLSGSYSNRLEEMVPVPETDGDGRPKTEAEKLIERVNAIQKELAARQESSREEEKVFTEEAVRQYEEMWSADRRGFRGGRRYKGGHYFR